jgi:pyrroline-5-carboxylate reductase
MPKEKNILFLGCGKMGSILANNLVEEKCVKASQIKVLKHSQKNQISGFKYFKEASLLPKNYKADLVFIAIKPQGSEEILKEFAKALIFHPKTIFISILAGKKIAFFEKIFSKNAKIVRSMPNLAIQDSQGVFTYLCNKNIKESESKNLKKIFAKFGSTYELEDEKLFDAATAIFGSGPAYIFLLEEIFTEIVLQNKITKNQAADLIKKLFLGSALMSCNSDLNFLELRESVTSKGGTTDAALKVLQKNSALKNLFQEAVAAAILRSKELSDD